MVYSMYNCENFRQQRTYLERRGSTSTAGRMRIKQTNGVVLKINSTSISAASEFGRKVMAVLATYVKGIYYDALPVEDNTESAVRFVEFLERLTSRQLNSQSGYWMTMPALIAMTQLLPGLTYGLSKEVRAT